MIPDSLLDKHDSQGVEKRHADFIRWFSDSLSSLHHERSPTYRELEDGKTEETDRHANKVGGMSRRLAQMTEESLEQGGYSAQKAVAEAGFSEDLRKRLEQKILDSTFKNENPAAFAELTLSPSAGQGTRSIAVAQPWTGAEAVEDAALRMLTDAHKPLRGTGPARIPRPSLSVDMRMQKAVQKSQGQRLANARDRTSVYALSQDPSLTEYEKEQMRKQLKERFHPSARPMPGTLQGLAALANERIEDAIARGQFRNIARGKGKHIERDYTASSPFLDTTEYFMNKIIQKQEIVPPWIEKQQELVKAAAIFRARLRADWKRHAVRVIASKGGSLEEQVRRAEANAAAEAAANPKTPKSEILSNIDADGKITQLAVPETSTPPPSPKPTPVVKTTLSPIPRSTPSTASSVPSDSLISSTPLPALPPFRDPSWEALENPYHTLAITSLNTLTRSYNLQAPALAQKPYFSLARELFTCFADVAPLVAPELVERARSWAALRERETGEGGREPKGVLERFTGGEGEEVRVFDSKRPHYGFRQFWRDMWRGK